MFDGDDKQSPPSAVGRKRPREDDELAETDDAEQPTMHPPDQAPEAQSTTPAKSGIIVRVNGAPMDFTDVTDDHHEMMTPEEYEAYFEVASSVG